MSKIGWCGDVSGGDWGPMDQDDEDDRYYDFDTPEDHDPEKEWVLNCGLEGCLMPGYHFRYECHTAEMVEAYNAECEASNGEPNDD